MGGWVDVWMMDRWMSAWIDVWMVDVCGSMECVYIHGVCVCVCVCVYPWSVCVCIHGVCVCVSMENVCADPWKPEEWFGSPGSEVAGS